LEYIYSTKSLFLQV